MKHPHLAGRIQHHEALAALFSDDLANRRVAHFEVANVLEALLVIRVAGHKPLADAPLGVADH